MISTTAAFTVLAAAFYRHGLPASTGRERLKEFVAHRERKLLDEANLDHLCAAAAMIAHGCGWIPAMIERRPNGQWDGHAVDAVYHGLFSGTPICTDDEGREAL